MRVMLTENGIWGPNGPHAGDEGNVFYFAKDNHGRIVFLARFPGHEEYFACNPSVVTALITEVMDEAT
jgi:hypothetical protein